MARIKGGDLRPVDLAGRYTFLLAYEDRRRLVMRVWIPEGTVGYHVERAGRGPVVAATLDEALAAYNDVE